MLLKITPVSQETPYLVRHFLFQAKLFLSGGDFSDIIAKDLSLQEGGDTPSRTPSPCDSLSNNPTFHPSAVHIDGGAGLVSTERCGRPDATGQAVKQSASGTETSARAQLVEVKREFIKASVSSVVDEDVLVTIFFNLFGR
ncbi:hypothetical protein L873DRAFT_1787484 [Choiromyces venosus 120613-1]|uniref:Uncharacterized protein n=1 Tax=Choiromyces venosus 120613-1 TaxID=1336337 RepID=A0A3N4JWS8_9PEZI|nr:hypothetical protein L873DRAFT_1787484 [Choiromyces venosus 120613-1]